MVTWADFSNLPLWLARMISAMTKVGSPNPLPNQAKLNYCRDTLLGWRF
jgi:hypothetical protein